MSARLIIALATLSLLLSAGCGEDQRGGETRPQTAYPAPSEPLPRSPGPLATRLAQTTDRLREEIDVWRENGDLSRDRPPRPVVLLALHQQRIIRRLSGRSRLARRTIVRLPRRLRGFARDTVGALDALHRLTPPLRGRIHFRAGRPRPIGELTRHYRKADRRFGVSRNVLAAINFVETAFGKLKNESTAGALGPMQFIPATWRAYGMGGNIRDPHDAIMGAANYLRASGAPRNYRRALYAYNNSELYVDAVLRYARRIRRDRRDLLALYSWQVYVRTAKGDKRLTGPRD